MIAEETIADLIAGEVRDGLMGTGAQVFAAIGDEVVIDQAFGVDGVGRHVAPDTLFAIYCAGKPLVALAVGCLFERGEVSFDDRLGDVIDPPGPGDHLEPIILADLMSHSSGVHLMSQQQYMSMASHRLDAAVANVRIPRGWRHGKDIAYSEAATWHLLDRAVSSLAGQPTREVIRRDVLGPLGLVDDVIIGGMTEDELDRHGNRLGVNIWLSGDRSDPLLMEQTRRLRCAPNAAVGSSASIGGLGRVYMELLRISCGTGSIMSTETLARLTSPRVSGYDQLMQRECTYGMGFMTELTSHRYGNELSPAAYGHSGNGGMTAAFADPDQGTVVAYHFNGRIDGDSAVDTFRPMLLNRIVRALRAAA